MSLAEELGLERSVFPDPAEEAVLGILRTAEILSRIGDRTISSGDVTQAQFNILKILSTADGVGMSQKDILRQLISTKGNLSVHVANLEERGLISRRTSDDDGRRQVIQLTRRGRQVLDQLDPLYREQLAAVAQDMTSEEFELLTHLMDRLRARCSELLDGYTDKTGGDHE